MRNLHRLGVVFAIVATAAVLGPVASASADCDTLVNCVQDNVHQTVDPVVQQAEQKVGEAQQALNDLVGQLQQQVGDAEALAEAVVSQVQQAADQAVATAHRTVDPVVAEAQQTVSPALGQVTLAGQVEREYGQRAASAPHHLHCVFQGRWYKSTGGILKGPASCVGLAGPELGQKIDGTFEFPGVSLRVSPDTGVFGFWNYWSNVFGSETPYIYTRIGDSIEPLVTAPDGTGHYYLNDGSTVRGIANLQLTPAKPLTGTDDFFVNGVIDFVY